MSTRIAIEQALSNPYDGKGYFVPAKDFAHLAARAVIADLLGRKGIRYELEAIENDDIRHEIINSLSDVIRSAKEKFEEKP